MKKRLFIQNAVILTLCSIFLSALGMAFRVYQSSLIGAEGMGLLQLLLSVYYFSTNLAVSGLNLAVTRLVSESAVPGSGISEGRVLRKCFGLCLLSGCAAGSALFFGAPAIGRWWLGDTRTVASLRVLAVGLPFLSVSCCVRGYFLAARNSLKPSTGQILEQLISFAFVAVFFSLSAPGGLSAACCGIALGMTVGEICGNLYIVLLFFLQTRRTLRQKNGSSVPARRIFAISLPVAVGYCLRSALVSVENVLIPAGLKRSGSSYGESLAGYGIVKGMALPALCFPQAFLTAFSMLLIPEVSEARAARHPAEIRSMASRVFQICLLFSCLVVGLFFFFGRELGLLLYKNAEAGRQLRLLCPLIPFMYLDSIVDAMLKGLDEQVYSLKVNLSDSCLRILLIALFVPRLGISGYLLATFFSVLYNSSLSIGRLMKKSAVRFPFFRWIVLPLGCIGLCCSGTRALFSLLGLAESSVLLFVCAAGGCAVLLYPLLLRLTGCISSRDLQWFRDSFCRKRKGSSG
ncbi:MAG: oligosaccharide flippase family protein [Firmicutes bacterium]|nr:oligosaccharide flippase family protein [Bacillota bacterium]